MWLQFYYDQNGNCVKEASDPLISQPVLVEIDSNNVPRDTISAISGLYYTAMGNAGDIYSFKTLSAPAGFAVTCPASGIVTDTLKATTSTTALYAGMQCTAGNRFDLSVNAVIPVTGVQDEWGDIYVQNKYCMPANGTLTLHYSPKYADAPDQIYPPAASVSNNTIVWNLNSLSSATGGIQLHYSIWARNTHVPVADTVRSYFQITPLAGDSDTTNNTIVIVDTVRAGCDPNEMWVSPSTCIPSGTAATLKYTINFENTGNDTAHNIYVLDTLSNNVDASSFRLQMCSAKMNISKLKDAAGHTVIKFDLPGINLLDSSHHAACDGAVIFTVNSKAGLPNSTHIYNRAGIYFDVNGVVMTNQVDDVIGCATGVNTTLPLVDNVVVYPNPAGDIVTIRTNNQYQQTYTITNSIGQIVLFGQIPQGQKQVSIKTLPTGLYFVHIKDQNGDVVKKLLKM